jgi:hypothetical protein
MKFSLPTIIASVILSVILSVFVSLLLKSDSPQLPFGGVVITDAEIARDSVLGTALKEKLEEKFLDRRGYNETNVATILKSLGQIHEFDGGLWFSTSVPLPPCEESTRGLLWFVTGESEDNLILCKKLLNGSLNWVTI